MEFEPSTRMITQKEIMKFTGLTQWQTQSFLFKYGVQIGTKKCMSIRKLKSLIDDGTVERHKQKRAGRPGKQEG